MSRTAPKIPCPECDGLRSADAPRCRPCYVRKTRQHLLCPQCKTRCRARPVAKLCQPCHLQNRAAPLICPGCGGRKDEARARRCRSCVVAARTQGNEADGWLLVRFDRHAFRALLEREQWSARDLARVARLSPTTINQWLSGVRRPRLTEWRMAAEALALDPCSHCGGSGTVEVTAAGIHTVTAMVERREPALLLAPSVEEQDWQLDPNRLVLTIAGVAMHVTPQESRLIATLASAHGRYVPAAIISEAMRRNGRGPLPHAVHTYLTRLRDKCAAAGADLGLVVQNGRGSGYRAVMAYREEVAS